MHHLFPSPLLLALCVSALLGACSGSGGGGASTSSGGSPDNSVSGTLVTNRTFGEIRQAIPTPVSGDGIWDYSVATDYYWGSVKGGAQPSLVADFAAYSLDQKITYAFPVFGFLDHDSKNSYISNAVRSTCYDSNQNLTPLQVFSYVAMPQLKPTLIPNAVPALGDCVDGLKATAYYKKTVGIARVVPVIEMSDGFNSAITFATGSTNPSQIDMIQLMDLATTIANQILADDSVYGVAFDNEPAIFKAASTGSVPKVNCQGLDLEAAFYGTIAHTLASASSPKYLFLFDAPDTARALYKGVGSIPDPNNPNNSCKYSNYFPALRNIVMMPALYDLETIKDDAPANGPLDVPTYSQLVAGTIKSSYAIAGEPPAMVVLPASATDTMWSSLQAYNVGINKLPYSPPTSLTETAQCSQDAFAVGTVDYVALTALICSSENANTCPNYSHPVTSPATNITNFLKMCSAYPNKNTAGQLVLMNNYFTTALSALSVTGIAGSGSSRYLGASLYAWRIAAASDLQGAVNFYSVYGDSTQYKPVSALFPMEITPTAWNSYLSWYTTTRPNK